MADELLRLAGGRPIDVALLPINGRRPERRVPGNFWGDEAAHFAHAIGARLVVPMHYEMFAFNTETPELFVATAERLGQPHRVLRCGELLDRSTRREEPPMTITEPLHRRHDHRASGSPRRSTTRCSSPS